MRMAACLVLIVMCGTLRAEQGSQLSASHITIVGVAKGGTYSIGYAMGASVELSVQTIAGDTAEQVAAKLVAQAKQQSKLGSAPTGTISLSQIPATENCLRAAPILGCRFLPMFPNFKFGRINLRAKWC